MKRWLAALLIVALPLADLAWNLTHLNIGLVDFYGLTLPALGLVQHGAWPATPYFPAGYPLLLIPFGFLGSTLVGGYIFSAIGAALALWGVRRLALELGAPEEWTLAAVALAWAEPTFRVTAGSPTPDMLYTGLGIWFLIFALVVWRRPAQQKIARKVLAGLIALAFAVSALRYHGLLLATPVFWPLIERRVPAYWRSLPFFMLLGAGVALSLVLFGTAGKPLASKLQVRVGLETTRPTFYDSPQALFANYANFAEQSHNRSVIADYGLPVIAKHTVLEWMKYLRRPPVAFAILLWFLAVALRRLDTGFTPLSLWILAYTLALSVAYYTPRAALLPVVVAVALLFALLPRLATRRSDLALGAACLLLLAAYWPAGKFARADMAQRRHFAEASRIAAQSIREMRIDPESYIVTDMRVIRLPGLDNPWQIPFRRLAGQTWLDDPAIRDEQLPGYRSPDSKDADERSSFKQASPAP